MKLVFNKTGDELLLTQVNYKLFEYYVDNLNQQDKNKFLINYTDINTAVPKRLSDIYVEVNDILAKFKMSFPWDVINPLDQNMLNQLHSHWVMLEVKQPNLLSALKLMGEETVQKFRDVNELIHKIENMFHVNFRNFTIDPWKTPKLAKHIGLDNLKSITVYDSCFRQLELAKMLHSNRVLPNTIEIEHPYHGEYSPDDEIKYFWGEWHNYPVKFELINLFDTPKFLPNSYVWVSNAFLYEPTLFEFGYQYCQNKFKELLLKNKDCKININ